MKKWFMLVIAVILMLVAGCGSPAQEAAEIEPSVDEIEEEIVWDMIPVEEQSLEITFTDEAKARMDVEWGVRSNNQIVFSMIPGSS